MSRAQSHSKPATDVETAGVGFSSETVAVFLFPQQDDPSRERFNYAKCD